MTNTETIWQYLQVLVQAGINVPKEVLEASEEQMDRVRREHFGTIR